ncbi:MAG: hypothetical protein Q9175_007997 [Cornicularia normoerica]
MKARIRQQCVQWQCVNSNIDEDGVLNPRGGGIKDRGDEGISIWTDLQETAEEKCKDGSIQGQLQRAGL